eukprot:2697295-Lingulodinium_polyedra.AAC.1
MPNGEIGRAAGACGHRTDRKQSIAAGWPAGQRCAERCAYRRPRQEIIARSARTLGGGASQ